MFFIKYMKKKFLAVWALCGVITVSAQSVVPAIPVDNHIEKKIQKWVKKMTLEEKIGQMCQITIGVITGKDNAYYPLISDSLLDIAISKYKVGSFLNAPFAVSQPKEIWAGVITQIQKKSMKELNIPCIYGVDQIHGASYTAGSTFFPQEVNMGAAFNRGLTRQVAEISAYETRACCIPWNFSPVVDLGRDPRWPRMWENFGEDAYLNAEMGREMVKGYQGENPNAIDEYHVAACLKHFMGYGVPVSGKDRTPSSITETDLREKHFAPFLEAIRNGALSLMVNSASNNGVPFHANHELLTGWLKEQLAWDGMIVTDWNDINNLYSREGVAKSKKDAVRIAINAGIDMAMVPMEYQFCVDLKELVEEGEVKESRIDDAVSRVLRLKYRLGLFDRPYWDINTYTKFASDEFAAVSLQAAEESEVLLKNNRQVLPLKKGTKILLTGPNANAMRCLNGGWSYSWQGDEADKFAGEYNTIYEAFQNKFGKESVVYAPGVEYDRPWNAAHVTEVMERAACADVIVACIGENSYCETPGNINDLTLDKQQLNLVKQLSTLNKPLVLILNEGRPRIINEIEPLADAIVDILLPGNYGADALANLISGEKNFCGRLPFTYPRYVHSLATYDFKPSEKTGTMSGDYNYDAKMDVQWNFGHGLSYTEYEYSNFRVNHNKFSANDELEFSVDVKNVGKYAGKESVLLFTRDLVASSIPDVKRLRNFEKIALEPGEQRTVSMRIKASDLAFVGYDRKWHLEKGEFAIYCGSEKLLIECQEDKVWQNPNKIHED